MQITIPIPEDSELLVKAGEEVTFETPFLNTHKSVLLPIPVASKLGIEPSKIFHHLKKFVGEKITKDDVLATKKGVLSTNKVISEHEGIIKEIDHTEGNILIQTNSEEKNVINCYFSGHVAEVEKNSIKLKVHKMEEFPLKKDSPQFGGSIYYIKDPNPNAAITAVDIENSVVVGETITPYMESKFEALGVNGFVILHTLQGASSVPFAQLKNIDDFKKILHLEYGYCVTDPQSCKIYFYQ